MDATEEKVTFSAFLRSRPLPVVDPKKSVGADWFEWTDHNGNTMHLCLVIDADGGPPRVMAERNGAVSVHNPFPWM